MFKQLVSDLHVHVNPVVAELQQQHTSGLEQLVPAGVSVTVVPHRESAEQFVQAGIGVEFCAQAVAATISTKDALMRARRNPRMTHTPEYFNTGIDQMPSIRQYTSPDLVVNSNY